MSKTILINYLKITDCKDDDEDMSISISIKVYENGIERIVFNKTYNDVYVEEENKIGNDSRCKFFSGEQVSGLGNISDICITVNLNTKDHTDGYNWGGDHDHKKNINGLASGVNNFKEGKSVSSNPHSEGEYELYYTIINN